MGQLHNGRGGAFLCREASIGIRIGVRAVLRTGGGLLSMPGGTQRQLVLEAAFLGIKPVVLRRPWGLIGPHAPRLQRLPIVWFISGVRIG